jgi:ribosomal protein S13
MQNVAIENPEVQQIENEIIEDCIVESDMREKEEPVIKRVKDRYTEWGYKLGEVTLKDKRQMPYDYQNIQKLFQNGN